MKLKQILILPLCLFTSAFTQEIYSDEFTLPYEYYGGGSQECFDPCFHDCGSESGYAWIDCLYFRAERSPLDFIIESQTDAPGPYGKVRCVNTRFDRGWRIGLTKNWKQNNIFSVRYSFYQSEVNTTKTDEATTPTMISTRNNPVAANVSLTEVAFAQAVYEVKYNSVEIEIGTSNTLEECHSSKITGFIGLFFSSFNQKLFTRYSESLPPIDETIVVDTIEERAYFDMYAFHSGIEGLIPTRCQWLSFFGRFCSNLGISGFDHKLHQRNLEPTPEDVIVTNERIWLLNPSFDLSSAVVFDLCSCGLNAKVYCGYEMRYFCCTPDFLNFVDNPAVGNLSHNQTSLQLHGIYLRAECHF